MTDGISLAAFGGSNARDKSEEAPSLAALIAEHSALLFRVAHSILRNRSEADDVVQDTFVRVLQHRHKLARIADHRAWLVRIAWNLALDRRRKLRPEQMDDIFAATLAARHTPADTALHEAQQIRHVFRAIDTLPKAERQVLLLTALEELDAPAVASIVGKSPSACRALLFRARTRLKERLRKGGIA